MKPVKFDQVNAQYGKPSDMTDEECKSLPVCVAARPSEPWPSTISKWEMTEEELAEINRTKCVHLVVVGTTIAPSFITGLDPFTSEGYEPLNLESDGQD